MIFRKLRVYKSNKGFGIILLLFSNFEHFSFAVFLLVIKAGNHKMFVRVANTKTLIRLAAFSEQV